MDKNLIEANSLVKEYKVKNTEDGNVFTRLFKGAGKQTVEALKGVTFSVSEGEFVGLVGNNGAGKSTLVKLMTGILYPGGGTLRVLGRDPFLNREQNSRELGVVFGQRSQLKWDLSPMDSFRLLKMIYQIDSARFVQNVALFEELFDMGGFTLPDMLAYILLMRVFQSLYPLSVSDSLGEFIKNGEIAVALLRPVRVELQFLSAAVGGAIYDFCFCGLPSLLMFLLFVPVSPFCFAALPKVIAWLFGSFVFVFLLELTVGTLGYYTNNLWGLGVFKGTVVSFLSGELLPLHFYPARLLSLFGWLPFASMYYVPVLLFLGKSVDGLSTYSAVLWIGNLLLAAIYLPLSKRMIRHITVQGG